MASFQFEYNVQSECSPQSEDLPDLMSDVDSDYCSDSDFDLEMELSKKQHHHTDFVSLKSSSRAKLVSITISLVCEHIHAKFNLASSVSSVRSVVEKLCKHFKLDISQLITCYVLIDKLFAKNDITLSVNDFNHLLLNAVFLVVSKSSKVDLNQLCAISGSSKQSLANELTVLDLTMKEITSSDLDKVNDLIKKEVKKHVKVI